MDTPTALDIALGDATTVPETEAWGNFQTLRTLAPTDPNFEPLRERLGSYVTERRQYGRPLFPAATRQANQERESYLTGLFTKPLDQVLPASNFAELEKRASFHPDPEAFKQRAANRSFLTALAGREIPPEQFDYVRAAYAKQSLGLTDTSDKAVFGALKSRFQEDETSQKNLSEISQNAFVGTLTDAPLVDSAAALAILPERHREAAAAQIQTNVREARRVKRKLSPVVDGVMMEVDKEVKRLSEEIGMSNPGGSEQFSSAVDKLPTAPEERRLALAMLAARFKALPDKDKAFAERFRESLGRGISLAYKDAEDLAGNLGIKAMEVVGASDLAAETSDYAQARQDVREFTRLYQGEADPLVLASDNWAKKGFILAGGSAWTIPATLMGPAGFIGMAASMGGTSYNDARAINPKADAGAQLAAATVSGPAQAFVEVAVNKLGFKAITGKLPGLAGIMNKMGIGSPVGRAGVGGAIGFGTVMATEYAEEGVQSAIDTGLQDLALEFSSIAPTTDWKKFWGDWATVGGQEQKDTLRAIMPFALVGAGGGSFSHFKYGKALSQNKTLLRAIGVPEAKVQEITRSTDIAAADKAMQAAFTEGLEARTAGQRTAALEVLREQNTLLQKAGIPRITQEANSFTDETLHVFTDPVTAERVEFTDEETALEHWRNYALTVREDEIDLIATAARVGAVDFLTGEGMASEGTRVDKVGVNMTPERALKAGIISPEALSARIELFAMQEGLTPQQAAAEAGNLTFKARRFSEQARDGQFRYTVELYRGANVMDVFEDLSEDSFARALDAGFADGEILLDDIRRYEDVTGQTLLPASYSYTSDNRLALLEALSALSRAHLIGNIRADSLPPEIAKWVELNTSIYSQTLLGAQNLSADINRAGVLKDAIKAGNVSPRLERLIADSIGINADALEQRLTKRMEEQLAAEAMGGFPEIAKEAKGMIPHPDTMQAKHHPFAGEVRRLLESLKKSTRRKTKDGKAIDRTNEANAFFLPVGEYVDLDKVRERLNQKGFEFDTPADLIDALETSLSYGKPVYGTSSRGILGDSFSIGRGEAIVWQEATDEDRKRLRIPPAWTDVKMNADPNGMKLAVGKDAKGRGQAVYSPAHHAASHASKFERAKRVNAAMPAIGKRVGEDSLGGKNQEEAAVVRLIYLTGFRNGGDGDTGAEVQAYGASTLLAEHVEVNGDEVAFDFTGKLGVAQKHVVKDAQLAKDIAARKAAGGELFKTNSTKVLSYLRKISEGDFKVHDLRTWNATELANRLLAVEEMPADETAYWLKRDAIGDIVARKLGDTRKIVLDVYIDPIVFAKWAESVKISHVDPRPKIGKRDAKASGAAGELSRPFGEYERALRDEFLPPGSEGSRSPGGRVEQAGFSFSIGRATVRPTAETRTFQGAEGSPTVIGPATFSIGAYHGTPHLVDEFTTERIGSGEGAQVYGWGLYFASNKSVAEWYRRNLSEPLTRVVTVWDDPVYIRTNNGWQAESGNGHPLGFDSAEGRALDAFAGISALDGTDADAAALMDDMVRVADPGNLYTVALDFEENELLDWEALIDEQSPAVLEKLTATDWFSDTNAVLGMFGDPVTGRDLYQQLVDEKSPAEASRLLATNGIPGIKFLDGSSRGKGEGTRNYVVFEDASIEIAEHSFSIGRATVRPTAETRTFQGAKGSPTVVGPASFSIGAYHGTPHKVDKFTTEKIGSGEGAQAYGWGLYFAQDVKVARWYRDNLKRKDRIGIFDPSVQDHPAVIALNVRNAAKEFKEFGDYESAVQAVERAINSQNLYTVALKVEDEDLLDWDKPLSEQSEKVRAALPTKAMENASGMVASEWYQKLTKHPSLAEETSKQLHAAGIKGIRYLDGNSRSDGEGSYNYVIFNENDIEIVEENGTPVELVGVSFALSPSGINRIEAAIAKRITRDPDERAAFYERVRNNLASLTQRLQDMDAGIGPFARKPTDAVGEERRRIQDAVAEARAIITALPIETRGRVNLDFADITGATSERGRINALIRLLEKADDALEITLKSEYFDSFERLLDLAKPNLMGNKQIRGRLTPETQRLVKQIADVVTLTPVETAVKLKAIQAAIDESESTPPTDPDEIAESQKALIQLYLDQHFLETFASLSTRTAGELSHAFQELLTVYTRGRTSRQILDEAKREEMNAAKREVLDSLPRVTQPMWSKRTEDKGLLDLLESGRLSLSSFHQVMEALFPNSQVARQKQAEIRSADRAFVRAKIDARERFEEFMRSAFNLDGVGARRKWNKILAKISTRRDDWNIELKEGIKSEKEKMTEEQAASILDGTLKPGWETDPIAMESLRQALLDFRMQRMKARNEEKAFTAKVIRFSRITSRGAPSWLHLSDMEAVYMLQLAAQDQYLPALDKYGFTAPVLDAIRAKLDPQAATMGTFLRKEYDAEYDKLNPVFRTLYGLDMPRIRNYAPGLFDHLDGKTDTNAMDAYGNPSTPVNAMSAGFTKARSHHMARPRQMNAMGAFWAHLEATEYFIAYAETMRDMRQIFRNPEVRRSLEGNYGTRTAGIFSTWLDALEVDGKFRAATVAGLQEMTANTMATQSAIGLAFNIGVLFKQFSAATGVFMEMKTTDAIRGVMATLREPDTLKHVWAKESIQQRILGGMNPEDKRLLDAANASPSLVMELLNIGRMPIAWADAAFTTVSGAIAYNHQLAAAKKAGMDNARAEEVALEAMDRVITRTAQPATTQDKSLAENTANGFGRFLFLFKSDPRQKFATSAAAFRDFQEGKIGKAEAARRVFWSWCIYGLLAEVMTDIWAGISRDDDDEERWAASDYAAAMVAGPISGIPLLGSALSYAVTSTIGTKAFSNSTNPLDNAANRLFADGFTSATWKAITSEDTLTVTDLLTAAMRDSSALAQVVGTIDPRAAIVPAAIRAVRDVAGVTANATELVFGESSEDQARKIIAAERKTDKGTATNRSEEITKLTKELAPLTPEARTARLRPLDKNLAKAVETKLRKASMTASERALSSLGKEARARAIDKISAGMDDARKVIYLARLKTLGID